MPKHAFNPLPGNFIAPKNATNKVCKKNYKQAFPPTTRKPRY